MKKLYFLLFIFYCYVIPQLSFAQTVFNLAGSIWPPFEYQEAGINKGADVEILNEAFKRLNITLKIEFYPWVRCEHLARHKVVDGIFTLRKTEEREKFLIFPKEPINYSENHFFHLKNKKFVYNGNLENLKGLLIGLTRGYNYGSQLMNTGLVQREYANKDLQNLKKIVANRIDLFICDRLVGSYLLKQHGMAQQITYLPKYFSRFEMFIGLSQTKQNITLAPELSRVLKQMKADGTYQKIIKSYLID